MQDGVPLPTIFCWTRFGTEAGETIDAILERKERERRANGGVYFWGIGNSVAPGLAELVRRTAHPNVLFSPIKSRPRAVDVHPPAVVRWRGGVTLSDERISFPHTVRVMSGQSTASRYALVCASDDPLRLGDWGRLKFGALQNLLSGKALGSSQVTAVVERRLDLEAGQEYPVAFRARLIPPYFLRLVDPAVVGLDELTGHARAA
jgi:hypothetical protein